MIGKSDLVNDAKLVIVFKSNDKTKPTPEIYIGIIERNEYLYIPLIPPEELSKDTEIVNFIMRYKTLEGEEMSYEFIYGETCTEIVKVDNIELHKTENIIPVNWFTDGIIQSHKLIK